MDSQPPNDYPFAFTLDDLFVLTDALSAHQRTIEQSLGKAYIDGEQKAQAILTSYRQHTMDLHGMLVQPIDMEAEQMRLAQQGLFEIDMGEDYFDDVRDPYEDITPEEADELYKSVFEPKKKN